MKLQLYKYFRITLISCLMVLCQEINAQTFIDGELKNNTIWSTSNHPYVIINQITIEEGVTLTIQPGTIIKFQIDYGKIVVKGTMDVCGTIDQPVIFTSYSDDEHGGDTNGDSTETCPNPGDWRSIELGSNKTSNIFLEHTLISYGGSDNFPSLNVHSNNVEISHSLITLSADMGINCAYVSPSIHDCRITENATEGIFFPSPDATLPLILTNNTFKDNRNWLALLGYCNINTDIILSGNTCTGSDRNGFGISGRITDDVMFEADTNMPIVIINQDLSVNQGARFTISPGTIIKFNSGGSDIYVNGVIVASGTMEKPIIFTSIDDDSSGGDTNNNKYDSIPSHGTWGGIWFDHTNGENFFNFAQFKYGGINSNSGMINLQYSKLVIKNCIIANSRHNGLYIDSSDIEIRNTNINFNNLAGIFTTRSLPVIINNNINDNIEWGVYNEVPYLEVDASNNWWGNITGPYHPLKNKDGKGNEVSNYVLSEPYLTSSVDEYTNIKETKISPGIITDEIYPNPVSDKIFIPLRVSKPLQVLINLVNLDGKIIETLFNDFIIPGDYTYEFMVTHLKPGIY